MKRLSIYFSICLVFSLCFELEAAGILRQRVAQVARAALFVPMRHASTKVPVNSPERGVYTQATEDPIFKYMMQNDEVRNSFLTGVIGEEVTSSELMDLSLNPMRSYTGLRTLLNSPATKTMMETMVKGSADDIVVSRAGTRRQLPKVSQFLKELSMHYVELIHAFPDSERNTQLDLLCQTESGLINVEVQVDPQDFWDIRILAHACGLFQRQFPRGFEWSRLSTDAKVASEVRRVIGVSIFEKSPASHESVHAIFPWYKLKRWKSDELRRNYRLLEMGDHSKERGGLEFFDYNLAALKHMDATQVLKVGGVALKEWLDLLANAQFKTKKEVLEDVTSSPVQKAYALLESSTLPEKIRSEYEQAQVRRYQISHYVADEKRKGREEGKAEGVIEGKVAMIHELVKEGALTEAVAAAQIAKLRNEETE